MTTAISSPLTFPQELRRTLQLALPLVGAQVATMGVSFVDTIMAGRLSAEVLAAVAVGASGWAGVSFFAMGTLMVLQATVARLDSARQIDRIAPHFHQALWVSQLLALGLVLAITNLRPVLEAISVESAIVPTAQGYLRALAWGVPAWCAFLVLRFLSEGLGRTRPTLYFSLLGLPLNVLLNWMLMYGRLGAPALGAVGCGYATAIVWWLQLLAMAFYVGWLPQFRRLKLFQRFDPPRLAAIRAILRTGTPSGMAFFLEVSLFAGVALFIGSLGTVAIAAHQLAINFSALCFMAPLGISMAISVRVGNARGRGDRAGLRRAVLVGLVLVIPLQILSASIMLLFPRFVAGIYTSDPRVIAIAIHLLFFAAIFQLSDGLQVAMMGALRGLEDTTAMMIITAVAYWLVGFPLGWALGFPAGLGPQGMWIGLIAGLTVAALLLALRYQRVVRAIPL